MGATPTSQDQSGGFLGSISDFLKDATAWADEVATSVAKGVVAYKAATGRLSKAASMSPGEAQAAQAKSAGIAGFSGTTMLLIGGMVLLLVLLK